MTRFLLIFIIFAIFLVPITAERLLVTAEDIARKCCTDETIDCCANAIKNRTRLNCPEFNREDIRESTECLQQEIFGKNLTDEIGVDDLKCCQVFTKNDNDPDNECPVLCSDTVLTIGMDSAEKIHRIQNCENGKTLVKCFKKCLELSRESKPFSFRRYCSWKDRMIPGQLYIGDILKLK
uniref:Uncharacterized protein n=1 Tax=Panagrolaimus sp. JU765 TaxID=591449 RepID=A0AC34QV24_9BILA